MKTSKLTLSIFWSDEDNAFIALCLENKLSAFASTRQGALKELEIVLEMAEELYKNGDIENIKVTEAATVYTITQDSNSWPPLGKDVLYRIHGIDEVVIAKRSDHYLDCMTIGCSATLYSITVGEEWMYLPKLKCICEEVGEK